MHTRMMFNTIMIDWSLLSTHNKTYIYIHENTDINYISVQINKKNKNTYVE